MSNEDPIYAHAVPISSSSNNYIWPWVIVIIILIIVIIILAIWLAVKNNQNSTNGGCRLTGIQGASILSSSGSVSGSWTLIPKEDDKVTLYVSEGSLTFAADGTAKTSDPTKQIFQTSANGSNNSVSITSLTNNTLYNAALVATGSDTNHYAIYGPVKVYTQETADLAEKQFNILSLNGTGGVSGTGGYTPGTPFGVFSFSNSNIVVNQSDDESPKVLCRSNSSQTDTSIMFMDQTDANTVTNAKLCQWSYNDSPPVGVDGKNLWCLTATQNTNNSNGTSLQPLCLAINGNSLNVVTPAAATTWYNPFVST